MTLPRFGTRPRSIAHKALLQVQRRPAHPACLGAPHAGHREQVPERPLHRVRLSPAPVGVAHAVLARARLLELVTGAHAVHGVQERGELVSGPVPRLALLALRRRGARGRVALQELPRTACARPPWSDGVHVVERRCAERPTPGLRVTFGEQDVQRVDIGRPQLLDEHVADVRVDVEPRRVRVDHQCRLANGSLRPLSVQGSHRSSRYCRTVRSTAST